MQRLIGFIRIAVVAAGLLALAGCGANADDDGSNGSSDGAKASAKGVQLYFVDGNLADYSADFDRGTLEGVRGTLPGSKLGEDFKKRMLVVNPKLKEFNAAPESYDATVVTALAALEAKSDDSKAIAARIIDVTTGGEKCTDFKTCAEAIKAGKDVDYDGVAGPIEMGATGSPSAAEVGVFEYGADNTFANEGYVTGKLPEISSVKASQKIVGKPSKGDGTLTLGTLLPATGDLAFLGPPSFTAVDLAIKDINAAGGVLGKPVKAIKADSGDGSPNIAPSEVDKLLRADVDAIVGTASSSVSLSVIDKIVGAGVVQVAPANSSPAFDAYADKGLFFRTTPSDVLQGQALAQTVSADGYQNLAILARQDSYGEGLAQSLRQFFQESGGTVVSYTLYDSNAANFTAEVEKVKAQDPEAIALIGFDETKKIVPALIKAGLGQKQR